MAEERDPLAAAPPPSLAPDVPTAVARVGDLDDVAEPGMGATGAVATSVAAGSTMGSAIDTGAGTGRPGASASGPAPTDDPEQIREQIERTREDMSQTLNELQHRLSPQHLAQQARESVREATVGRVQHLVGSAGDTASQVAGRAQDAAGTVVEQVREHPVPVALAGIGAGLVWWMMRRSSSRQTWSNEDMYDWDDAHVSYDRDMASLEIDSDDGSTRRGSAWASNAAGWTRVLRDNPVPASIAAASIGYMLWNRRGMHADDYVTRSSYAYGEDQTHTDAHGAAGRVAETAREVTHQAREKASEVTEKVGETMRHAQHRATEMTHDVQRRLRSAGSRTTSQFDRWMRDNPMAIGIAALAAGAVVGLSMPRTRTEDAYMGASRDALVDRATDSAQQIKEQVREKVQTVASDLASDLSGDSGSGPAASQA